MTLPFLVSTFAKSREKEGGNSAFHLCCMGRSKTKRLLDSHVDDHDEEHDSDVDIASSSCADSIDMLLRYTSIKDQKRALMSTNIKGENLFHLACSKGDLPLLERLLDCHDLPGVKISKALEAKNKIGYTPFLSAVASNS